MQLTDLRIRQTKPGDSTIKLPDGGGLYLEVTKKGSKLWRYRFRLEGKENTYAIGAYPEVSLQEARRLRDEARAQVKLGINPARKRQASKNATLDESRNTFEVSAQEWLTSKIPTWSKAHGHTVRTILRVDILPRIGKTPIRDLQTPHLHDVMKRIVARGAATRAILARQVMGAVFDYAILESRVEYNPTAPLKRIVARCRVEHRKHLEEGDIGDFLRALADYTGHDTTRIALNLLLLTAVRPGELCAAPWREIDLHRATWTIQAQRMKGRKPHVVPLSKQAVALLQELEQITGDHEFLFPCQGNKEPTIPTHSLRRAVTRLGYGEKFNPHGARGTFSTLMNGRGWQADLIERQLAHVERNRVRASYHHTEYLVERRQMMQAWADLLDEFRGGAKIIQLKRA